MLQAVERARVDHWGHVEELLAQQVELLHSIMRVLVQAYGKKGQTKIEPFRYPRPGQKRDGADRVSWSQLAAMMMGG